MVRKQRRILAIDPGTKKSGYAIVGDNYAIMDAGKIDNETLIDMISGMGADELAIEHMESRRVQAVQPKQPGRKQSAVQVIGAETFETCIWIGKFTREAETHGMRVSRVYRSEERSRLIPSKKNRLPPLPPGTGKTADAQIKAALVRRFAKHDHKRGKGTANKKDTFYGFKEDMWSAFAVAVVYLDKQKEVR